MQIDVPECRYVHFGARETRRSGHMEECAWMYESVDVYILEQEGAGGQRTVEEYTWMH